ncbi:STAS domain-containing protein [Pseudogracilibacillus auburnensis]|uniref:STAS domain-containing protein n=1 Tax=Pseudogracilibacillus auburnensis TaxID=1494959 RepID=UPI00314506DA
MVRLNLKIDILREENNYIVRLTGEIDVYTAPKLKDKLLPLTEKEGNKIKIDLANTTYLDSTGLGVFISAYKSTKQNNSNLKLIHVRDRVLRLFQVTGLHEIMNLEIDER